MNYNLENEIFSSASDILQLENKNFSSWSMFLKDEK